MANKEHLKILKQGVDAWNEWREENPEIEPDLSGAYLIEANLGWANLSGADLYEAILNGANLDRANLSRADLSGANLYDANLGWANLSRADLSGADLYEADLCYANLGWANLSRANLSDANLNGANLSGADLYDANLIYANLNGANLTGATLTSCTVYGISVWDLKLDGAKQSDLIITPPGEPAITVDNLEVAQFIYLLLYNKEIRHVIDTITSKVVLILGRFNPPERKAVLDAIREELRKHNYSPVLFDFEKPASRDFTETISTLAHLSRFIIADITEPRSVPQELQAIVPDLPSVPVQPLLWGSSTEYGMFEHFKRYPWVLKIYRYDSLDNLLASLEKEVIIPAEAKVKELRNK